MLLHVSDFEYFKHFGFVAQSNHFVLEG